MKINMIVREQCCCDKMYKAILSENKIPICAEKCGRIGNEFYGIELVFVDVYNPKELASYGEVAQDSMSFCPFCGCQVDPCATDLSGRWKTRKHICEDFQGWFMKGHRYPNFKAPTPMFRYEPKENRFYMRYRKGFGEGWIPITYCIYCGEPLAEMVEKYGIPKLIADKLDPPEWQGKYKLCEEQPEMTDYTKWPNFYQ